MKNELFWLCLTLLFTVLQMLPYIIERISTEGFSLAAKNPQPSLEAKANWAIRAQRAQNNSFEYLTVFSVLVLILNRFASSDYISTLAMSYFLARLGHYISYTLGIPYARQLFFVGSFTCLALLFVECFKFI